MTWPGTPLASLPPGAMSGSMAWRPNAAWRAAILSVSQHCLQSMRGPPNWAHELLEECTALTYTIVRSELSGAVICMDPCQDTSGRGIARGGCEPIVEQNLFEKRQIDGYFPKYDPERADDFAALRLVPNVQEQTSVDRAYELSSAVQRLQAARAATRYLKEPICSAPRPHGLS